jgi:hypothetical protein
MNATPLNENTILLGRPGDDAMAPTTQVYRDIAYRQSGKYSHLCFDKIGGPFFNRHPHGLSINMKIKRKDMTLPVYPRYWEKLVIGLKARQQEKWEREQ